MLSSSDYQADTANSHYDRVPSPPHRRYEESEDGSLKDSTFSPMLVAARCGKREGKKNKKKTSVQATRLIKANPRREG